MLSHITFSYPPGATGDNVQKWFYIRGKTLLDHLNNICERSIVKDNDLSEKLLKTTLKTPLSISLKGDVPILNLIGALQENVGKKNYFNIGGRTISMGEGQAKYYVLDRTDIIDVDLSKRIEQQDEDAFKNSHKYAYIYIDGKKIKGPSYGDYASYLRARLGNDIDRNVDYSKKFSSLLSGGVVDYSKSEPAKDPSAVLPVLLSTMFLAEPARNPRSLAINMMLLNLIEGKVTYGSSINGTTKNYLWDMVLWHPDKLDGVVSKKQRRAADPKKNNGIFKIVTAEMPALNRLRLSGGKLPAAMMTSGHPLVRTEIDPDKFYTQEKELSILIRWLCAIVPELIAIKGDDDIDENNNTTLDGEEIPAQAFDLSKIELKLSKQPWANTNTNEYEFAQLIIEWITMIFVTLIETGPLDTTELDLATVIQVQTGNDF